MYKTIPLDKKDGVSYEEWQNKYLIDLKAEVEFPPVALSLGYNYFKGKRFPITIGSYGDFSCIVGASKSMKSFFKTALIASYIGGSSNNFFPELRGHSIKEKFILDIDTEQSKFHAQRSAQRVLDMVGRDYSYYKPFTLRGKSPKERLDFLEWLLFESEFRGHVGLLTIDGAADLVNDVNDLKACNKVVQDFMKWTTSAKCHICTVIHKNYGSTKPTGHLGSAILKKAETVMFLERENEIIHVRPGYTRNYAFQNFSFRINDQSLPTIVEEYNI